MIEELEKHPQVKKVMRVGSTVSCNPAPENTDIDYLVLVKGRASSLDFLSGYNLDNDNSHYEPSEGDFNSWRKDNINLIITDSVFFFEKFKLATELAKHFNLLEKKDRIKLFQAVLYSRSYE